MNAFRWTLLLMLTLATALPAFGANTFGKPVVTVYPLTFAGIDPNNPAGADVALILATKLAEGNLVIVKPYIPGSTRAQYLDNAIASRADYYVTGFLQAIGSDVSMIVQVVSTHSGSVVFSTTTTIVTFSDAAAQADPIREAILRHAGRGYASLDAPAAVPSPSEAPASGGINITKALRKRQKATPRPSASPTSESDLVPVSQIAQAASPSPASASPLARVLPTPVSTPAATPTAAPAASAAPQPTRRAAPPQPQSRSAGAPSSPSSALVLDSDGNESDVDLAEASDAFMRALRKSGIASARLPIHTADVLKNAASICRANAGTQRFYGPTLLLGHDESGGILARLSVDAIDCTGATIAQQTIFGSASVRAGAATAIARAAEKLAPSIGRL